MKNYFSNEAFFGDLRALIEGWCDRRCLVPLARVLPAYTAFYGLADSWGELAKSLKAVRALGHEKFSTNDWELLNDLIHAADQAIHPGVFKDESST
jgi:hypothetical protein